MLIDIQGGRVEALRKRFSIGRLRTAWRGHCNMEGQQDGPAQEGPAQGRQQVLRMEGAGRKNISL